MFAAEENYENEPINYSKTAPEDAVTRLQQRLAAADIQLPGDEKEILRLLLVELDVPISSQLLVFSRTSLQRDRISPTNPRALYYSHAVRRTLGRLVCDRPARPCSTSRQHHRHGS